MKRVVVTGMGIWSCIGQDLQTVTESLKQGRSGIIFDPKRIEYGLHSGIVGNVPRPDLKPLLPRKFRATMSEDAEYAYMAARQALEQAMLLCDMSEREEIGLLANSTLNYQKKEEGIRIMQKEKNALMLGPSALFQTEASSCSMNLASIFGIKGINMSFDAGCASSSVALAMAAKYIQMGLQDTIVVVGTRAIEKITDNFLDKSGEILSVNNDHPAQASCPFDIEASGRVSSGGAAALVLEEYEHAINRGVEIFAEVTGASVKNNGNAGILLSESDDCMYKTIIQALKNAKVSCCDIDYVNASVPSIPESDSEFARSLNQIFANSKVTQIGATTSITGYENEMSGVSEVLYSILMMRNNFISPILNLKNPIPLAKNLRLVREIEERSIRTILNITTGTGGICCAVVLKKM